MSQSNFSSRYSANPVGQPTPKVYKSRSGCFGKGCFFTMGAGVFIILVLLAGYLFIYPMLTPNTIRGDFQDMTYVPTEDGKVLLWIQTDGSFKYIHTEESPGHKSMGVEGIFCKTYTYLYDPVNGKVIRETVTDYDEIPPTPKIFMHNGRVWVVSREQGPYEPRIDVYDPKSGDKIKDTQNFLSDFSGLASGLVSLRIEESPLRFVLKTKDGGNPIYLLAADTLFATQKDYRTYMNSDTNGTFVKYFLADESGADRQKLFKVTGKGMKFLNTSISESLLDRPDYLKEHYDAIVQEMTPGKAYLEAELLYYDDEGAVIIHQDQIGKNADRILTVVDSDGNVKWQKSQDELFPELEVTEEDAFSVIFFMKDKIHAERAGNTLLFQFDPEGIIGFDYTTGEKLWELDL